MTSNKPNIIYILADDLGYGDLSCFNVESQISTPHLNDLANLGMRFTDAHSSSALCTPSRYSILTGRYNWRSKLKRGVVGGYTPSILEDDRTTVGDLLKKANYQTSLIGKWHLGLDWTTEGPLVEPQNFGEALGILYDQPIGKTPVDYGFDYFYGISASLDMPPYVFIENNRVEELPDKITEGKVGMQFWRKGPTAPNFFHEDVLERFTEKVMDIIDQRTEDPFFIFYSLTGPHTPILPREEFIGKSATNLYGDFVMMCDEMIGNIVQKLEEEDLTDDTIVIFASDNGAAPIINFEELEALGHFPSKHYRGAKADIYEGGHRIPMIVKWPNRIAANTLCDETVCLTDFIATISDLVEIPLEDSVGEDSVSNLPLWNESVVEVESRLGIVHHSDDGSLAIRKGSWKLETCPGSGGWSFPSTKEELIGLPPMQLYDLEKDPSETTNLYESNPDISLELLKLLEKYIKDGRSTNGEKQVNEMGNYWNEIEWIKQFDVR